MYVRVDYYCGKSQKKNKKAILAPSLMSREEEVDGGETEINTVFFWWENSMCKS